MHYFHYVQKAVVYPRRHKKVEVSQKDSLQRTIRLLWTTLAKSASAQMCSASSGDWFPSAFMQLPPTNCLRYRHTSALKLMWSCAFKEALFLQAV